MVFQTAVALGRARAPKEGNTMDRSLGQVDVGTYREAAVDAAALGLADV